MIHMRAAQTFLRIDGVVYRKSKVSSRRKSAPNGALSRAST
ncbi:hypothetical protein TRICHSKD4_5018 [Roseibium sp. TrichSKD4]|nr:hypothetical protein TRICHSKD4_5018 [Roseibium sp. TrichSKD4]